jgi:nitrate/nitrite transporter NarK
MIILSKTVRRECRGAMYGICCAFGAMGGFSGLTLGKYARSLTDNESLYALEMALALLVITLITFSKLYKAQEFERPL